MAPPHVATTDAGQPLIVLQNNGQDGGRKPPNKKPSNSKPAGGFKRKRTGCMTCRRRKIACRDERKPVCINCEKSKLTCEWEDGIWKHEQNPSVAGRRETKFHQKAPAAFAHEDQQRLTNTAPRTEYQFVIYSSNNGDPSGVESSTPPPPPLTTTNSAALQNPQYPPLDPHNLQALASAATFQNAQMPPLPLQWENTTMIDPSLEARPAPASAAAAPRAAEEEEKAAEVEEDVEAKVVKALGGGSAMNNVSKDDS